VSFVVCQQRAAGLFVLRWRPAHRSGW
jgi:hypothetical protein